MAGALALHDQILASAINGCGGTVFRHLGDGVCAAFSSAPAALKAAVECQGRLAAEAWGGDRLGVRMGLHTGEAVPTGGDYSGPPVNRASRVMGTANGGQIVCSAATAGLCPGVEFRDAGIHQLVGVGAEHLFVVVYEWGDDRLLRSSSAAPSNLVSALDSFATPGNLGVQSSSFVGRQAEVKELCELVRGRGR